VDGERARRRQLDEQRPEQRRQRGDVGGDPRGEPVDVDRARRTCDLPEQRRLRGRQAR
jgi:hypothetical protein